MTSYHNGLPKEVVALVHHVELNGAGWWEKAVQRLIMGAIWLSDAPPVFEDIKALLVEEFRLSLTDSQLTSALAKLDGTDVLRMPNGTYTIVEQRRKSLEVEIESTEKAQNAARDYFCSIVTVLGITVDGPTLWKSFELHFLNPLIKEIGANTYSLIKGEPLSSDNAMVGRFLGQYASELRPRLKELVTTFLDPKREETRNHIMRLLHARFCIDASGLSEQDVKKLSSALGKNLHFRLFVDTNFLFSLMDIHENPSNEAAQELKELVAQLKTNPRVTFYMSIDTMREAQTVIEAAKFQLSGIPTSSHFARAAIHSGLSGIGARFMKERLKRGANLTIEAWFGPYLNDFVTIARGKGVQLHNEKLDDYTMRQDVIDDISSFISNEESRYPEDKRRSYNNVRHDMVLWHFVKDRRPAYVESPLEADDWIITVDMRLINFDRYKQRVEKAKVPLCIHPASMVQLLQFWVPRSKDFEEAMLGSMRLPFLFQEFNAEAEQTTLKILRGLGKFHVGEEVSEETITQVVLNDSLRTKLSGEVVDDQDEAELIRDALVEEMKSQLASEKEKAREAEEKAQSKTSEAEMQVRAREQALNEKSELEKRIEKLEAVSNSDKEALRLAESKADEHKRAAELARQEKEQAKKKADEKEMMAQEKDAQVLRTAKIASFITGILAVILFEALVHLVPCFWLLNHPKQVGLEATMSFGLFFTILGVWVPQWRKTLWLAGGLGLLFVFLSIVDP
jgi:hypothetical protein